MTIAVRIVCLVLLVSMPATASVVTERWGAHPTADHTGAPSDASPLENYPDWAADNGAEILVGDANGGHRWGLVRFDLAELAGGATVRSARLVLSVYNHGPQADGWLGVHRVLDPDGLGPFDQAEVTFNHRRAGVPWTSAGGSLAAVLGSEEGRAYLGNLGQYQMARVVFDVTDAVRLWVASPASNSGLALPFVAGVLYGAGSSENPEPSRRAFLEITYEGANPDRPPQPGWVEARHRSGQTFITFAEAAPVGEEIRFRVYRHTEPIHAGTVDGAELLAELTPDSGHFVQEDTLCQPGSGCSPIGQSRFIVEDDGEPLAEGVGLWVHTLHEGEDGDAFYAVTTVAEGNENRDDFVVNAGGPVSESVATPRPVRVWTNDTGTGWVYTQFMDARTWNDAVDGSAYNAYVGVPAGYDPAGPAIPLAMRLHAWGGSYRLPSDPGNGGTELGWPVVWVAPDDPSSTWWFGFGANAGRMDRRLADAPVVNYTQQRLDALVDFVMSELAVDPARVYVDGGSMGGAGAFAYGLRRGERFAAVYSGKGMTDFASAGAAGGVAWEDGAVTMLWGTVEQDLPTNLGPSVWEILDLQTWVATNPTLELPFLACHHGLADDVIDWETQGLPWYPALEAGRVAFVGVFNAEGHNFDDYWAADSAVFRYQDFALRRDEAVVAFANATSSDDPTLGVGCRNCRLEWSSSWNDFAGPPVDTPDLLSFAVRSTDGEAATVDVAPRRTRVFSAAPGARLQWRTVVGGQAVQSGEIQVPDDGVWTIPGVLVDAGVSLLEIRHTDLIFADGFESGTTARWSIGS